MKKILGSKTVIITAILLVLILILGVSIVVYGNEQEEETVEKQLALGERYLNELDYNQAIIACEQAIEIDDRNAETYIKLARAYRENGETKKAIEVLQEGIVKTRDKRLEDELQKLYAETVEGKNIPQQKITMSVDPTLQPEEEPIRSYPTMEQEIEPTTEVVETEEPGVEETIEPEPTIEPTPSMTVEPTTAVESTEPELDKNERACMAYAEKLKEEKFSEVPDLPSNFEDTKVEGEDGYYVNVALLDLDQDGCSELLFNTNACDSNIYVYSFDGENVIYVGEAQSEIISGDMYGSYSSGPQVSYYSEARMLYTRRDSAPYLYQYGYRMEEGSLEEVLQCGDDESSGQWEFYAENQLVSEEEYNAYLEEYYDHPKEQVKFMSFKQFIETYS